MDDFSFFFNNKLGGDIITFGYRYRKQILIGIGIFILLIGSGLFIFFNSTSNDSSDEELLEYKKIEKKESTPKKSEVKVDIKGAINLPGIYSMENGKRVVDVIDKAGGLLENADTSVINLSKKVTDEMVIIIYTKEEVKRFEETKKKEEVLQNKCNQKDDNSLKNDACIKSTVVSNGKISLNKATAQELMTLSGIGEAKAKEIILYREKNGPFKNIEELTKVPGIGDNIFAQIKENITV